MQSGSKDLINNLSRLTEQLRLRFSLAPLDVLKIYRTILQFSQQEIERINNEAKEKWGKETIQPLPNPLKYIQLEWAIYHKIYRAVGILGGISAEKFDKKTQQEYFYAALYLVLNEEYSDVLGHIGPAETQYLFGLGSKTLRLHTFTLLEHLFELPKDNCETLAYLVPGSESKEMKEVLAPYEIYKKAKSAHTQIITELLPTQLENLSNHLDEQLQAEVKDQETLFFRNTLLPLKHLPSIQLENTKNAITALNHTIKKLAKQPFIDRYKEKEEAAELTRDCETIKDEAIGNENNPGEIPTLINAIKLQLGNLSEDSSDPVISRLSAFKKLALKELQSIQEKIEHLNPTTILELLVKERHNIYSLRLQVEQESLNILKELTFTKLKIFSTYTQLVCKEIEEETDSYLNKLADEIKPSLEKDKELKTDPAYSQDDIYQFALNNMDKITDDLNPLMSKFCSAYLVKTAMKKNNLSDAKICIDGHLSEFKTHRGSVGFVTHYLGLDERFNAFKPRGRVWAEFFCEKEKQVQEFLSASAPDDFDIFEIDNGYIKAQQEKDRAKAISGRSRSRHRIVM